MSPHPPTRLEGSVPPNAGGPSMTDSPLPPARRTERGRGPAGQRQRYALTELQQEPDARQEMLEVLRARRGGSDRFRQFDIEMLEHGEVLRLSDELLAKGGAVDDPAAVALIAAAGFTAEPVEGLR